MNTWRLSNPKRPQAQLPAPHDHAATRRMPQPWMFISLPYDTCDNRTLTHLTHPHALPAPPTGHTTHTCDCTPPTHRAPTWPPRLPPPTAPSATRHGCHTDDTAQ